MRHTNPRNVRLICTALALSAVTSFESQANSAAPTGTYIQTCGNIQWSAENFTPLATCLTNDGRSKVISFLNVIGCERNIFTDDGILACRMMNSANVKKGTTSQSGPRS